MAAAALGVSLYCGEALAQAARAPEGTSLGSPRAGAIAGSGSELPNAGDGYRWQTNRRNPGARFGTPRMVAALRRAAATVATAFPQSVILVFDLALQGGGRIHGHGSHTNGRDVDVGYYARDAQGNVVALDTPVRFDAQGNGVDREGHAVRFDAERTWAFFAAVMTDANVSVQRIFIYPPLRTLILAAARAARAEAALVSRAAAILRPPGNPRASLHDDHFHIRLACTAEETRFGCRDGGGHAP